LVVSGLCSLVYFSWVRPRAYPKGELLLGVPLGKSGFLTNISLDWKGLPVTNTLAYYELISTDVKKFTALDPGPNVIKLFTVVSYEY
jgi:hypothetical protein